ncbi:ABC transporter substrate-binding protein [Devosia sediminis]|uniref:Iron-siderophore ABC transporter substrate-binding protein n=1 Tax=Devosia sediminis TaxID=2798801 RepID=A0A934IUU8_9HYPH|nr:iron-siderophore ABC transporter substrate-binding protein [Devosia sediminis]MBJ3783178.1 iron-siderophore ABC transporter substrate-binding protein [Devosia sediminis]
MTLIRTLLATTAIVLSLGQATAREITHAMGVTDVPDNPQRIVVLTNEGTEALLSVGVTPVGAVESWKGNPWYDYLMPQMGEVTLLGTEGEPNLELIATLEPDLILGSKVRQEKIYEQLSAIAPTVLTETLGAVWQENLIVYADAVGKADEGEAAIAAFDARAAAISAALGDKASGTISLVRISPARTRMYFKDSFPGVVIDAVGLARPETQDRDEFAEDLTKERIPELAADRIFYFSPDPNDAEAEANLGEWLQDPLWLGLDAVKAGNAQRVDDAIWVAAGGVFAANTLLDDIEAAYGLVSTR